MTACNLKSILIHRLLIDIVIQLRLTMGISQSDELEEQEEGTGYTTSSGQDQPGSKDKKDDKSSLDNKYPPKAYEAPRIDNNPSDEVDSPKLKENIEPVQSIKQSQHKREWSFADVKQEDIADLNYIKPTSEEINDEIQLFLTHICL